MMKKMTKFLAAAALLCGSAVASQAQAVFTDDYASGVTFNAFGGSTNALSIDNSQFYTGTAALKIEVPAAGYTGGALKAAAPANLTTYNALTFWVKASAAKTLNVVGLGNNAVTNVYQTELNALALTTTWKKVIIPIPNPAKLGAEDGLMHFAEGSDEGAYTIWIDDVKYENLSGVLGTPIAAIATETQNVLVGATVPINGTSVTVPVNNTNVALAAAKAYFTFTSSNTAAVTVDSLGVARAVAVGTSAITARLGSVTASGTVTVNVAAAANPTTSAPAPTQAAADVISLFSNAYTNRTVDTWSAPWDQADVEDYTITGNDVAKKYTNLLFAGIEFTSSTVNATAMTHFRADVWSPNASVIRLKLVDFGANGAFGGGDDTEHELSFNVRTNEWNALNIPLTNFVGMTARAHVAQMIISGAAGSTVFLDNVYFYRSANVLGQINLPVTFDLANIDYTVTDFGGNATTVVNDPTNANNKVGRSVKSNTAELWAGTTMGGAAGFATAIPFSANSRCMSMRIYSPNANTVIRLKAEDANDPNKSVETEARTTVANAWETLYFDFSNHVAGTAPINYSYTYKKLSVFFNFGTTGASAGEKIYLWDDVRMSDTCGAPAARPLTSAPTPNQPAAKVISLFSNAYTNRTVDTWSASWDQADVEDYTITGNDIAKKYSNLVFAGIEFTSAPVNATNMTHFHVDVWTPNASTFRVKLVDFGANGTFGGGDDTEHELTFDAASSPVLTRNNWVSIDVPLTRFAGMTGRSNIAQMIISAAGGNTAYIDNVYFYTTATSTKEVSFTQNLFKAYPSVAAETVAVEWQQALPEGATLTVQNALGQVVEMVRLPKGAASTQFVSVQNWAEGLYLVTVQAGAAVQTQKIMVQH